jgi:hypothetical protein
MELFGLYTRESVPPTVLALPITDSIIRLEVLPMGS